jgi:hypothetical protein
VVASDARKIGRHLPWAHRQVTLVVTSPPYLDTTNYQEDQWLRLWFLGGAGAPVSARRSDDRHSSNELYWDFLEGAWNGVAPLLKDGAHIVIRLGGKDLERRSASADLKRTLARGTGATIRLLTERSSPIVHSQLKAFRPGARGTLVEHDFHFRIC